jgi:hypothetical protein
MTEKRYFYRDPLAAAWMAKHFGMKFTDAEGERIFARMGRNLYRKERRPAETGRFYEVAVFVDKVYIHPDSLPLLEPQENDVIYNDRR